MQPTKALVSLRYVTRIAAVIILVMVAVGFFLPSDYRIERSVVVSEGNQTELKSRLFNAERWSDWMLIQSGRLQLSSVPVSDLEGAKFQLVYDEADKQGGILVGTVTDDSVAFLVTPSASVKPVPNVIYLRNHTQGLEVSWVIEGVLDAGFLSPYLALLANSIAGSNLEASLARLTDF